jgi:RNase adaptor protein for sRNA GlmZ degradation
LVEFEDAESYLLAVVQGRVAADPLRLQAAKAVLPYQRKKRRSPLTAQTAKQQAVAAEKEASASVNEKFKLRLAEIKRKKEASNGN